MDYFTKALDVTTARKISKATDLNVSCAPTMIVVVDVKKHTITPCSKSLSPSKPWTHCFLAWEHYSKHFLMIKIATTKTAAPAILE